MENPSKSESAVRGARATPMVCIECGHKFLKHIPKNAVEVKCLKCGGVDTEVA